MDEQQQQELTGKTANYQPFLTVSPISISMVTAWTVAALLPLFWRAGIRTRCLGDVAAGNRRRIRLVVVSLFPLVLLFPAENYGRIANGGGGGGGGARGM